MVQFVLLFELDGVGVMELSRFLSRRKRATSTPPAATARFAVRSIARPFSRWGAIAIVVLWAAGASIAGTTVIAPLPLQSATPGFGYRGITFDSNTNPLVLDRWAWILHRVDKGTGTVLSSVTSNPVTSFNDQLVFDSSTGNYFTVGYSGGNDLVRIDPDTHAHTTVGSLGVGFPNFNGLAVDPSGNLWFGDDRNGAAELWSVDKNTGAATFSRNITFPGGLQFHTLTVASDGTFYMAASAYSFNDGGEGIYRINSLNGAATFITSTDRGTGFQTIQSFDQDHVTGRFYGVSGPTDTSNHYYLVEIQAFPNQGRPQFFGWAYGGWDGDGDSAPIISFRNCRAIRDQDN
jgi:hypothetical protein